MPTAERIDYFLAVFDSKKRMVFAVCLFLNAGRPRIGLFAEKVFWEVVSWVHRA